MKKNMIHSYSASSLFNVTARQIVVPVLNHRWGWAPSTPATLASASASATTIALE